MLIFLIITILFIFGGMFATKIVWNMMQDGGMFDVLLGWHKLRDRLYAKGQHRPIYRLIENILGGCAQCMSFWFALLWTGIYYSFCKIRIGWISDGYNLPSAIGITIIWVVLCWAVTAGLGHWFLTKNDNSDAV